MSSKIPVFVFILCLVFLPAPATQSRPPELKIAVLAGPTGLALVQMMEHQPKLGAEVRLHYSVVRTPEQMMARIVSGEADIAAVPTNLAAVLYNRGVEIRLAAVTNWGVMYIVGRDTSIASWQDLQGRELAVTGRGTTPDILLRYFLEAEGLNPERDLRLQYYTAPVELARLVIAEKVGLATLPEPWVTEVTRGNPSVKVLLDYQEAWKSLGRQGRSYPQSCLVARAELAGNNPRLVAEFLTHAAAAGDWVNNHPDEAALLAEKHLFISAGAARAAVPRCNLQLVPAWEIREEIDHYLRVLYEFNPETTGGKLPDAGFYLQK